MSKNKGFDLRRLTKEERKIYHAVLRAFPATDPACAYNVAVQGGIKFQFIPT